MEEMMFTEEQYQEAECLLNKMLIRVMIDRGITKKEFINLHQQYIIRTKSTVRRVITYSRKNNLDTLLDYKKPYTYRFFEMIMKGVLQLNLVELSCTFKDIDGNDHTYTVKGFTY